jgi:hypothetical protein
MLAQQAGDEVSDGGALRGVAALEPFRDDVADKLCGVAPLGKFALRVVAADDANAGYLAPRARTPGRAKDEGSACLQSAAQAAFCAR